MASFGSVNSRKIIVIARKGVAFRSISTTGDEYQYLERSRIPTYHFQKSLPRLPVPDLDKSCERYVTAIRPITDADQWANTKVLIDKFAKGEGVELQAALKANDNANKHTNYISEPWFDMYLRARVPIPINYNPYLTFAHDPQPEYNDQLTRATNMVLSIGRFKRSLDANVLKPEVFHMQPKKSKTSTYENVCRFLPQSLSWYGSYFFKAFPLDMSQHANLFNTARIPRVGKDEIAYTPGVNHFVVLRAGVFYKVALFDEEGALHQPARVHAAIADILRRPTNDKSAPIGVLTTLPRDEWATTRDELRAHGTNAASLDAVDSALFVLCLDEGHKDDPMDLAKNLLMGDNLAANRWFDKSFSLIVDGSGTASINFEHSWGDGVAVLRMVEEVFADSCANHFVHPTTDVDGSLANAEPIDFALSDNLSWRVSSASSTYGAWCSRVDIASVEYDHMTRQTLKAHAVSPDAVMQLAIQLAYYRLSNGKRTATYESCSTCAFRKGRTETMRPATMETNAFVDAIEGKTRPSNGELRRMIDDCSKVHGQLVKEASMGQGFDRHLMGLKFTAERLGESVPAMFEDDVYKTANEYVLSTSTLSTNTIQLGGFGPVVPHGFGIGYNVADARIGSIVSTYTDKQSAAQMTHALRTALDDIKAVLDACR